MINPPPFKFPAKPPAGSGFTLIDLYYGCALAGQDGIGEVAARNAAWAVEQALLKHRERLHGLFP